MYTNIGFTDDMDGINWNLRFINDLLSDNECFTVDGVAFVWNVQVLDLHLELKFPIYLLLEEEHNNIIQKFNITQN